jgi:hypothetical protein
LCSSWMGLWCHPPPGRILRPSTYFATRRQCSSIGASENNIPALGKDGTREREARLTTAGRACRRLPVEGVAGDPGSSRHSRSRRPKPQNTSSTMVLHGDGGIETRSGLGAGGRLRIICASLSQTQPAQDPHCGSGPAMDTMPTALTLWWISTGAPADSWAHDDRAGGDGLGEWSPKAD